MGFIMGKFLSVLNLLDSGWLHFRKTWSSWAILVTAGAAAFVLFAMFFAYYAPVLIGFIFLLKGLFIAILYQNGLDAVYGRKLSMFKITPLILFASLAFLLVESHSYVSGSLELLLSAFPGEFKFLFVIEWAVYALALYLAMRCMFVGMILLEEGCSALEALRRSLKITADNFSLSFGVFICLDILIKLFVFILSEYIMRLQFLGTLGYSSLILYFVVISIAGIIPFSAFTVVFSYIVLVKSLLYKQLVGKKK